jgi:hypothetical protein
MPFSLDRHRDLLRLLALAGVLALVVAVAASLGRSRTVATRIPLAPSRSFTTHALPGFPAVALSLPRDWSVVASTPTSPYGGTFLTATEDGTAPRTGTSLAPEGPRRLVAELHRLPSIIPPLTYLQNQLGLRGNGERVSIAGLPGVAIGLAANSSAAGQDATSPWVFSFVAATTLPNGDLLVLRLEGPGRGADTDAQLFNRLLDGVSLPARIPTAAQLDPLDSLRTHPVYPPSATFPPNRAREVAVLGSDSDVITIELFSTLIPPLPPASAAEVPAAGEPPESQPAAYSALREIAIAHDSRFAAAVVRRLSSTRVLLTLPDAASTPPVAALAVCADAAPSTTLAAVLIARGQSNAATDLSRLLNRAADRLTFSPASDDLPALLSAGDALARAAAKPPVTELNLAFEIIPKAPDAAPIALIRITEDGMVESLRPSRPPHRIVRSAKPSPGNTVTVTTSRQVSSGDDYVDVLPRSFTIPTDYLSTSPGAPDGSAPGTSLDLLSTSRYIPGHRLLQSLPLLETDSAIVVSDSFPFVDFDTHSRFSFILISKLAKVSGSDRQTYAMQSLGTGRSLLVSFAPDRKLAEVEVPGQFLGQPISPEEAQRWIDSFP